MKSLCPICNKKTVSFIQKIRLALSGRKNHYFFGINEITCPNCGNILQLSNSYNVIKLSLLIGALIFITQAPLHHLSLILFFVITLVLTLFGLIVTQMESKYGGDA